MNYRHAFHAGNFADVLKHATLALVIEHLKVKPAPFRVIDTHAGSGLYDLSGPQAQRTGEWRDGIGRLLGPGAASIPDAARAVLAPYLDAVAGLNPALAETGPLLYPGSPRLALDLMRSDDRLIANELHPDDVAQLKAAAGRDARAKVMSIDGWQALRALLPPKERRGVILVDPPFEEPGDLDRLVKGLGEAVQRFATGIYLLWLPVKDAREVARLEAAIRHRHHDKLLLAELRVRAVVGEGKLGATALAILNPPYRLESQLAVLLAFLSERLAQGPGAGFRVARLSRD